jgi:hypothetical protein
MVLFLANQYLFSEEALLTDFLTSTGLTVGLIVVLILTVIGSLSFAALMLFRVLILGKEY